MRKVPGTHSVFEALKVRPKSVQEVWIQKEVYERNSSDPIIRECNKNKITIKQVARGVLDEVAQTHQGYVALVKGGPSWPTEATIEKASTCLIFALDQVLDPHNLGSIMRSAWNLSAKGMIICKDRASGLSPAAIKVASGGAEHIPILEVTNLHSELKLLKDKGFWVYGLMASSVETEDRSQLLFDIKFPPKTVLVLGAEESGLRKSTQSACDVFLEIPHDKTAESFNVSVAAAIVGFEFVRQLR